MSYNNKNTIGFMQAHQSDDLDERLEQLFHKAKQFASADPELSLILSRKIAEMLCRRLYAEHIHPMPDHIALIHLIHLLSQQKVVPRMISIHLYIIHTLTEEITTRDYEMIDSYIEPCLKSVSLAIDWYSGEISEENLFPSVNIHDERLGTQSKQAKQTSLPQSSYFAGIQDMAGIAGDDGLIIGKNLRLCEDKSFEHCACIGPTGSGKTVSFFIPNLLSLPHASIVVSDPKGELFQKTAAANLAQGKRVLVFNPFRENSMKYNPLALCRNVSEIRELAEIILANGHAAVEDMTGSKAGGSEWITMSVPLLTAFLIYVKDLKPPKNTVSYALQLIIENDIDTLKFLIMDSDEAQVQFNIFMQSSESEKTASSIKTVLSACSQLFLDPLVKQITSANEINPLMLREKPTVLYVMVPVNKSSTMSPLMATFFSQLLGHLSESEPTIPIYFLLDEFANIGYIPNIDKALATFRSRKISISVGIQSLNQLMQKYGEQSANTILDNLKSKFILPGLSLDSATYFSRLLGYKDIVTMGKSFGNDPAQSMSFNYSTERRELLTPDEIRRLEDEALIAIIHNRKPFKDMQLRYYQHEDLLELTQEELEIDRYLLQLQHAAFMK